MNGEIERPRLQIIRVRVKWQRTPRVLTLTPASVGDAAEIVADAFAAIWISVDLVVVAAI
jgi:hypothetical protein